MTDERAFLGSFTSEELLALGVGARLWTIDLTKEFSDRQVDIMRSVAVRSLLARGHLSPRPWTAEEAGSGDEVSAPEPTVDADKLVVYPARPLQAIMNARSNSPLVFSFELRGIVGDEVRLALYLLDDGEHWISERFQSAGMHAFTWHTNDDARRVVRDLILGDDVASGDESGMRHPEAVEALAASVLAEEALVLVGVRLALFAYEDACLRELVGASVCYLPDGELLSYRIHGTPVSHDAVTADSIDRTIDAMFSPSRWLEEVRRTDKGDG